MWADFLWDIKGIPRTAKTNETKEKKVNKRAKSEKEQEITHLISSIRKPVLKQRSGMTKNNTLLQPRLIKFSKKMGSETCFFSWFHIYLSGEIGKHPSTLLHSGVEVILPPEYIYSMNRCIWNHSKTHFFLQWNRSDKERQILHCITCMWNLKELQSQKQTRMVITRSRGVREKEVLVK